MNYRDDDSGGEEEEEVPQQVADLAQASVPDQLRGVRACKRCGIIKTVEQFLNDGCENCPFLDMVGFLIVNVGIFCSVPTWIILFLFLIIMLISSNFSHFVFNCLFIS